MADVTALFFIACPFTLLYDRMVLTDAFLAAFTALALLLAVGAAEEPGLRTGAALGVAIAFGVLSKTTGLVLFAVFLLAWGLLARDRRRALPALAGACALAATLVAYPLWPFFRKTDELAGAIGLREGEALFSGGTRTTRRVRDRVSEPVRVRARTLVAPPRAGLRVVQAGRGRRGPHLSALRRA